MKATGGKSSPLIERGVRLLRNTLANAWLLIAFVIGLLPVALVKRLASHENPFKTGPTAESYWLKRGSGGPGFDIRSNDQMIVQIQGVSTFRDYLHCTTSPRRARRLAGAVCLAVLRPISRKSATEDEAHVDPSIYPMY